MMKVVITCKIKHYMRVKLLRDNVANVVNEGIKLLIVLKAEVIEMAIGDNEPKGDKQPEDMLHGEIAITIRVTTGITGDAEMRRTLNVEADQFKVHVTYVVKRGIWQKTAGTRMTQQ
jgi:hypothetical protein